MHSLFFIADDATFVLGTHLAQLRGMAGKSLTDRVASLEAKVGSKTIQEQFREQAELIDELFAYRFEQLGKQLSPRFLSMERALSVVQGDVSTLKSDVGALRKDMVIVREGIGILLKRRPK
jgi:hypothetical protein